jgi:hypothetical protein
LALYKNLRGIIVKRVPFRCKIFKQEFHFF